MMSTYQIYRTAERSYATQELLLQAAPMNKRAIDHFRTKIGTVTSADDLLKDYKLYSFVMRAFGLEEQMYARALVKKALTEDPMNPESTVNKIKDKRFKELAFTLGLHLGPFSPVRNPAIMEDVVQRFVTLGVEESVGEKSEGARLALYFKRRGPALNNWYQVMGDPALYEVVRTVAGLPRNAAVMNIDRQKDLLASKLDIADFKDPAKLARFVQRFAALYDLHNGTTQVSVAERYNLNIRSVNSGPGIFGIDASTLGALVRFPR